MLESAVGEPRCVFSGPIRGRRERNQLRCAVRAETARLERAVPDGVRSLSYIGLGWAAAVAGLGDGSFDRGHMAETLREETGFEADAWTYLGGFVVNANQGRRGLSYVAARARATCPSRR
jgi:hypothetical protein